MSDFAQKRKTGISFNRRAQAARVANVGTSFIKQVDGILTSAGEGMHNGWSRYFRPDPRREIAKMTAANHV